jgi:catechol 2,3-dioxygenase-like lactoylglutathione lyase family enzyme
LRVLRSSPYFPVADVQRSARYYADTLGFATEYIAGEPPLFAICSRDHFGIFLRRVADPSLIRPSEAQGGTWDAFFWIDDVEALHAELVRRGATIVYGPTPQEYGLLELAVRDCDGHVLGFGQAMGGEE